MTAKESGLTGKFPRVFWTANTVELFERAAYYGMFIALALFLTDIVGFTDIETGYIVGIFAAGLYLLPTFLGALSDKIGFRNGLLIAFALLTGGYFMLGAVPTKLFSILSLILIMLGGSFVKPIITGTVAKTSNEENRAKAFSIFYQMVNIGAFLGKTIAKPLRTELGLEYINYYASSMALVAFFIVLFLYKNLAESNNGEKRDLKQVWRDFITVLKNVRFMALIVIVAGFWAIQGQLYASMPKYTLRLVGPDAAPEWLANINPFVVILMVRPITWLVRKMMPIGSITIAMALIPAAAAVVALHPLLEAQYGNSMNIFGLAIHPITFTLIIGIAIQGLSECFLSPRYLEFASRQAPEGQEGLYMGYSHLTTFFAWLFGFIASGYLLDRYVPDPKTLSPNQLAGAYDNAHMLWVFFTVVGIVAFILMLLYKWITDKMDAKLEETNA